jgi:hypothetical protein
VRSRITIVRPYVTESLIARTDEDADATTSAAAGRKMNGSTSNNRSRKA